MEKTNYHLFPIFLIFLSEVLKIVRSLRMLPKLNGGLTSPAGRLGAIPTKKKEK